MSNLLAKQDKINQELAILIDQDLKQEQALLKALIEEILKANEKIKNAHFERVEDTAAKLKVLNAEIKRIRKNIRAQDDVVQEKRLALLKESKKDYFAALAELRLKDVKDHFAEPFRKHLSDLADSMLANVKVYLPNRIKDFQKPVEVFYKHLKQTVHQDIDHSLLNAQAVSDGLPSIQDDINAATSPLKPLISAFKNSLERLLENHLQSFDTSELDELLRDIEATTVQDLAQMDDQSVALDEALIDELQQMDEAFAQEKKDTFDQLLNELPSDIDKTESNRLEKVLKDLQKQITKTKDAEALALLEKNLKETQESYFKTPVGKVAKKVEKRFKSEIQNLNKSKRNKRNEHLEQSYELKMQRVERSIQAVIDGASLKLRTGITALELSEDTYHQTIQLFEQYLLDLFAFERSIRTLFVNIRKKTIDLNRQTALQHLAKTDVLDRYKKVVQRLEIVTLQKMTERRYDFKKLQAKLEAQLEKERLEIQKLYAQTKITDQRFRLINRTKITKLDEIQALKFQLFQDEADIKLAEKEYDIQVLKAQSVYDHERAINKVQTERIDAGVQVNKAMVQATVKRQVNFADQQIRFADAELAARLEHIEYTLQQELSYTEETLGHHEKMFEKARQEIELDYQSKKQSIEQKKKLFQHSSMLKNVIQEELDLEVFIDEKREFFEEKVATDTNIRRYREQIVKAKEHAENAKEDALRLHEKDIESFEALKAESLERLANVEQMMAEPALLPYHEEKVDDQTSRRLEEMLQSAEGFLNEKLKAPSRQIQETQERLLELEKESTSSNELGLLLRQETELNDSYQEAVLKTDEDVEDQIKALEKAFLQETKTSQDLIETLDEALDQETSIDASAIKTLDQAKEKAFKGLDRNLDDVLREIDSTEDEWIIDLKRMQSDANRDRMDLLVKMQLKVEKIESLLKPAIDQSYKALNRSFKKEKF
jgi:hypothetical protein